MLAIFLALCVGVFHLLIALKGSETATPPVTLTGLILSFTAQNAVLILLALFLLWVQRIEIGRLGWMGVRGRDLLQWVVAMTSSTILVTLVVNGIYESFFNKEPTPQVALELLSGEGTSFAIKMVIAIAAVVVAPLVEEIYFRGVIFRGLVPLVGLRLAVAGSALLFAIVHGSLCSLLPLSVVGAILALAYWRSRTLWLPILMHSCFNLCSVSIAILAPGE